jgi:hypothetical protein
MLNDRLDHLRCHCRDRRKRSYQVDCVVGSPATIQSRHEGALQLRTFVLYECDRVDVIRHVAVLDQPCKQQLKEVVMLLIGMNPRILVVLELDVIDDSAGVWIQRPFPPNTKGSVSYIKSLSVLGDALTPMEGRDWKLKLDLNPNQAFVFPLSGTMKIPR